MNNCFVMGRNNMNPKGNSIGQQQMMNPMTNVMINNKI